MPDQQLNSNQNNDPNNETKWSKFLKPLMNERGAVGDVVDPPAGDPPGDAPNPNEPTPIPAEDDLKSLFTEDEIKEKKSAKATADTEAARRAKLTPDQIKAEDDAKAAEDADKSVPETYKDFKVPEGMEIDKEMLAEAMPMFKDLGLTQKEAQGLIDLYSTKIGPAFVKKQMDAWEAQKKAWYKETVANKEIKLDDKGANLDGHRVINTLFSKDEATKFKAELVQYGLDNHPWLNLLLTRAAATLKEDTIHDAHSDTGSTYKPAASLNEMGDRLYGSK